MELKEGYKLTEVGVIPEDWRVKQIGEIARVVRGGSPRPAGDPRYFHGSFIPWLTVAALTNISEFQTYVSETVGYLTEEGSKHSRILESGTLIVANSGATLGVTKILSIKCCANDGVAALLDLKKPVTKLFLYHYLNTQTKHFREVVATGNGQPNLNTDLIGITFIPVPPLPEQQVIAEALSDVDALITSLDRLITKKRDIKQGTMQQLLTGKKRLAGFTDKWGTRRLGEIGNTYSGLSGKSKLDFEDGNLPYITFLNVMNNNAVDINAFGLVRIKPNERQNRVLKNDILFNTSSETPEEVGMCSVLLSDIEELYLNSFCFGFRLTKNSQAHPLFLVYYLRSDFGRQLFYSLGQGATRYNLSKRNFNKIEIPFPVFAEQEAIAETLKDMGTEIEKLEQQRDKYRAVKQGMMKELLTGRIRLVNGKAREPGINGYNAGRLRSKRDEPDSRD